MHFLQAINRFYIYLENNETFLGKGYVIEYLYNMCIRMHMQCCNSVIVEAQG